LILSRHNLFCLQFIYIFGIYLCTDMPGGKLPDSLKAPPRATTQWLKERFSLVDWDLLRQNLGFVLGYVLEGVLSRESLGIGLKRLIWGEEVGAVFWKR
jgi:hypothetical protein